MKHKFGHEFVKLIKDMTKLDEVLFRLKKYGRTYDRLEFLDAVENLIKAHKELIKIINKYKIYEEK